LEIKDKKGAKNSMADHLSRMTTTKTKEPPINDFLWDDMLLKVETSHPWYANIMNFMVSGYVPPGENRKKLIYESRRHLLGCTVPIPRMCRWVTTEMCTNNGRTKGN